MKNISGTEAFLTCASELNPDAGRLRILTFTTLYPNAEQPNHGVFVETRLRQLLASQKVRSTVIAPVPYFPFRTRLLPRWSRYADIPFREYRHNVEIFHPRYPVIPRVGMVVSPALLAAGTVSLAKSLHSLDQGFDLIDAHYFYPDGIAAISIAQKLGVPVVITARGTDINQIPGHTLPKRMIQRAIAQANGLIAVSSALKDALVDLGAPPDKVQVLRNGVDLDLFYPADRAEARRAFGLTHPTLLSVGHLIGRKGHDRVIEALCNLPEFELLIVGDGPEHRRLSQLIERNGLGARVRMLGSIPHTKLPILYSAADALVLASSREGWANVLLESMACGTPVIASNIWGNPEVVNAPEAGVLMRENTPSGIVEAVRNLFQNLPTRVAVRQYAEGFDWEETTKGQLAVFERVVRQHRL
jgi:teichuronic acid biosynthesis glycosyltransferase TuaC